MVLGDDIIRPLHAQVLYGRGFRHDLVVMLHVWKVLKEVNNRLVPARHTQGFGVDLRLIPASRRCV